MHILVSNDDGYRAAGLKALAQAMQPFGRVTIVAPSHNHSGTSNALTLNRPLTVEHLKGDNLYIVSGTPSDCVHLAMTGLLENKPDIVVSGINSGANMADDTMYSGTVAAAIEGHIFGVPSFAFSQIDSGWTELDSAAKIAAQVIRSYLDHREHTGPILWNVNIPNMPYDKIKGIIGTRLGRRTCAQPVIPTENPRGETIYWLGKAGTPKDASTGTDFWATTHGYVSVTPLQIDFTNHSEVEQTNNWLNSIH